MQLIVSVDDQARAATVFASTNEKQKRRVSNDGYKEPEVKFTINEFSKILYRNFDLQKLMSIFRKRIKRGNNAKSRNIQMTPKASAQIKRAS